MHNFLSNIDLPAKLRVAGVLAVNITSKQFDNLGLQLDVVSRQSYVQIPMEALGDTNG